jgi:hypothetical protein
MKNSSWRSSICANAEHSDWHKERRPGALSSGNHFAQHIDHAHHRSIRSFIPMDLALNAQLIGKPQCDIRVDCQSFRSVVRS